MWLNRVVTFSTGFHHPCELSHELLDVRNRFAKTLDVKWEQLKSLSLPLKLTLLSVVPEPRLPSWENAQNHNKYKTESHTLPTQDICYTAARSTSDPFRSETLAAFADEIGAIFPVGAKAITPTADEQPSG